MLASTDCSLPGGWDCEKALSHVMCSNVGGHTTCVTCRDADTCVDLSDSAEFSPSIRKLWRNVTNHEFVLLLKTILLVLMDNVITDKVILKQV